MPLRWAAFSRASWGGFLERDLPRSQSGLAFCLRISRAKNVATADGSGAGFPSSPFFGRTQEKPPSLLLFSFLESCHFTYWCICFGPHPVLAAGRPLLSYSALHCFRASSFVFLGNRQRTDSFHAVQAPGFGVLRLPPEREDDAGKDLRPPGRSEKPPAQVHRVDLLEPVEEVRILASKP